MAWTGWMVWTAADAAPLDGLEVTSSSILQSIQFIQFVQSIQFLQPVQEIQFWELGKKYYLCRLLYNNE